MFYLEKSTVFCFTFSLPNFTLAYVCGVLVRDERGILLGVSITVVPLHFWVSIPLSKKGLVIWKSRSQSRKRDWRFESLDPSLEKGIKALKILRSVFPEKLNKTIKFGVENLDPSLDHCTQWTLELQKSPDTIALARFRPTRSFYFTVAPSYQQKLGQQARFVLA